MSQMTKKEKKILLAKMAGGAVPKKRRAPRKRAGPNRRNPVIPASAPARNGQGRRRGQKRQRGGSNEVTTFGNTRNFTIPIDEDIGTITGSTGYALNTFSINPGNPALLQFVSRIAQNYERYEFLKLRFEYRPSASVFAAVGSQGLVGIAATMDAIQAPPSNQAQADVLYHSPIVETARPTSLNLPLSFLQSKSLREKFFVRQTGTIPGGADPHLYDCGQIFFWTNGQSNANPIGTIRVVGSCRLSNPASDLTTGFPPNFKVAVFSGTNQPVPATGVTGNIPFPSTLTNPVGITVDATNSIFTLPAGNWLIDFSCDVDLVGVNTTGALIVSTSISVSTTGSSPFITSTNPGPSATNAVAFHAACSQTWFAQSNGTTTVNVRMTVTYPVGVPDIDAMIRFVAV